MIDITAYPYLSVSLVLSSIAVILVLAAEESRRLLVISGVLASPLALFSAQFIPDYWNPRVLFRGLTTLEDVLFSASMGIIVMALALAPFRHRIRVKIDRTVLLRRYAICLVLVPGLHILMLHTVFKSSHVMYSAMVAVAVFGLWLLSIRPEIIPVATAGLILFPMFYFVVLKLCFAVFPETIGYWAPVAQLPFEIGGVPAFELVWAAALGGTWPPLILYVCGAKVRRPEPSGMKVAVDQPSISRDSITE